MSKITTADCVAFIVANTLPKSYVADWKRIRKVKNGTFVVRTFENRNTGALVDIAENPNGELMGAVAQQPKAVQPVPTTAVPEDDWNTYIQNAMVAGPSAPMSAIGTTPTVPAVPKHDWNKICANPVTVDLSKAIFPKKTDPEYNGKYACHYQSRDGEWTGRIAFYDDKEGSEPDSIQFSCGPENKDETLDDCLDGGSGELLEKLFADMNPEIGAAENLHIIPIVKGVSRKQMWKVIRERLLRSGAIERTDWET